MTSPNGSLTFHSVQLPVAPQARGVLPYGLSVPLAEPTASTVAIAFLPGNAQTVMIESSDSRAQTYQATPDGRTLPGQVGPYACLIGGLDAQSLATVVLPPDIASFLAATPPLEEAVALLDALLSRIQRWSTAGCLACAQIARAFSRLLASYQHTLEQTGNLTVDLHLYLAILKNLFSRAAVLFGGRANEAQGTESPLLQKTADDSVHSVLNLDIKRADGSEVTTAGVQGGLVLLPDPALVGEILDTIAKGVIVAA